MLNDHKVTAFLCISQTDVLPYWNPSSDSSETTSWGFHYLKDFIPSCQTIPQGNFPVMNIIGYDWMWLDTLGYYWMWLDTIGYDWIWLYMIVYDWILLNIIGYYWMWLDVIGCCWIWLYATDGITQLHTGQFDEFLNITVKSGWGSPLPNWPHQILTWTHQMQKQYPAKKARYNCEST